MRQISIIVTIVFYVAIEYVVRFDENRRTDLYQN